MNEPDFLNLPSKARQFVLRLKDLGFDRTRIYGLFVMLGMYAGAPNTQEKIDALYSRLQLLLPIDRTKNIDEEIGHLYDGYDCQINEFCFRSGIEFNFREITVPKVDKSYYIVYLKNEGLLNQDISSIKKLDDATRLYDSFIFSLGQSSVKREASLIEAFCCGIFQIQLHSKFDVQGTKEIVAMMSSLMPPFLSKCFKTIINGDVDYFLGIESGQIALHSLMQPMEESYAKQMWAFQSSLFFSEGNLIEGIDDLNQKQWFDWVLNKAQVFDIKHPSNLLPFSKSNISLIEVPSWNNGVLNFENCEAYINRVWGFNKEALNSKILSYDYRAIVVHLIYSSLTSSREVIH